MGTKEFIRFILGIIVIVNGVLLSSYYLVISEPKTLIDNLIGILFITLSVGSGCFWGSEIIFAKLQKGGKK